MEKAHTFSSPGFSDQSFLTVVLDHAMFLSSLVAKVRNGVVSVNKNTKGKFCVIIGMNKLIYLLSERAFITLNTKRGLEPYA